VWPACLCFCVFNLVFYVFLTFKYCRVYLYHLLCNGVCPFWIKGYLLTYLLASPEGIQLDEWTTTSNELSITPVISVVFSDLKVDALWRENKWCSDSNPWPMDPKASVITINQYTTVPHSSCAYGKASRYHVQPLVNNWTTLGSPVYYKVEGNNWRVPCENLVNIFINREASFSMNSTKRARYFNILASCGSFAICKYSLQLKQVGD